MSGSHLSKEFFELVKAIGESKSKQEEDRIIIEEVTALKKRMPETGTSKKKMKELLVRLIYVEMLGHNGDFGYIKAVELTASTNLLQKRVGYLTASLVLAPDHDFRFMMVNQLQRDMNSINHLECWAALTAVSKLVTTDMVPAVIGDVVKLLRHDVELVRKKAVMALHRFHQIQPESVEHLTDKIRRALCDKDPAVMAASLCLLADLVQGNPAAYKDLVPSFVSILKQITEHRLPRDYDYHRIPAPWIQIRLLRIMAILGAADQAVSEGMYEILIDVMRRADTGINVGYAIMYECVRTVTTIYPNVTLLDTAASSIARFISSDNHNLKYLGITGLAEIVKDHPRYAADHQLAVIECLEDPDDTLRRKTLDLLYRMINPVNVEFIVAKLISVLESTTDEFLRSDLVSRITTSSERFAPDNGWYVRTMTRVFELAGDLVQNEVAHNLMTLIAEGSGDDEELDMQLRMDSVEHLAKIVLSEVDESVHEKSAMPSIVLQIIAWVLGEYGYLIASTELAEEMPLPVMMDCLAKIAERPDLDAATRAYLLTCLMKLVVHSGQPPPSRLMLLVEAYGRSSDLNVQQRCIEIQALLQLDSSSLVELLPADASLEDLEEDGELSFLDDFVAMALNNGATPYVAPVDEDEELEAQIAAENAGGGLKIGAYAAPEKMHTAQGQGGALGQAGVDPSQMGGMGGAGGAGGGPPPNPYGSTAAADMMVPPLTKPQGNAIGGGGGLSGGVSGPWGATPPAPAAAPASANGASSQATPGERYANGSGGVGGSASPGGDYDEEPQEDEEMSEKQKQAAMLFGGMGGGGAGGSSSGASRAPRSRTPPQSAAAKSAASKSTTKSAAARSSAKSAASPPPAAPAAAAPVDLLDMDAMGSAPAPAAAEPSYAPVDLLGGVGMLSPTPATPAPAPVPAAAAPTSAAPAPAMDVFADAGLAGPLQNMTISPAPIVNGTQVVPLKIDTPAFGGKWTGMKQEVKATAPAAQVNSPDAFMAVVSSKAGLHPIQAIGKTMEAILAGQVGEGGAPVLVHSKISPGVGTVTITVRSADHEISSAMSRHISMVLSSGSG